MFSRQIARFSTPSRTAIGLSFGSRAPRNLVLRITGSGVKTWTFLYASPTSRQRCKLSLGTYPGKKLAAAKDEALALAVAVKAGKDPLLERALRSRRDVYRACGALHCRARETECSGWATEQIDRGDGASSQGRHSPVIGHHRAEAVTKHHVMEVVEAVAARGSFVTADHVLGLIRAIYNWANGTGRLEVNPTLGLKKRNASKPRERVLSDTELRTLWQALDAAPKALSRNPHGTET